MSDHFAISPVFFQKTAEVVTGDRIAAQEAAETAASLARLGAQGSRVGRCESSGAPVGPLWGPRGHEIAESW